MQKHRALKVIWLISFLLSFGINALITFADIESNSFWGIPEVFEYSKTATTAGDLQPIQCPFVVTASDPSAIRVIVKNNTETSINPWLQFNISRTNASQNLRRDFFPLNISPHGEHAQEFKLESGNIQYGYLILGRAYLRRTETYPPGQTTACGIFYLNTSLISGNLLNWLALLIFTMMTISVLNLYSKSEHGNRPTLRLILTLLCIVNLVLVILSHPMWGLAALLLTLVLGLISIQMSTGNALSANHAP